jgi:hypothetical protein
MPPAIAIMMAIVLAGHAIKDASRGARPAYRGICSGGS